MTLENNKSGYKIVTFEFPQEEPQDWNDLKPVSYTDEDCKFEKRKNCNTAEDNADNASFLTNIATVLNLKRTRIDNAITKFDNNEDEQFIYNQITTLATDIMIPFGFIGNPAETISDFYVIRNYLISNWKDSVINYLRVAISRFILESIDSKLNLDNYLANNLFYRYSNMTFVGMIGDDTTILEANYILTQLLYYLDNDEVYSITSNPELMEILTFRIAQIVCSIVSIHSFYVMAGSCCTKELLEDASSNSLGDICQLPGVDYRKPMFSTNNMQSINYPDIKKLEVIYTREDR